MEPFEVHQFILPLLSMVRNHQDWYPYFNLSFFLFVENIRKRLFFWVKLIGQWIPDRDGRGIARGIKKKNFIFETWQKMVTKFGQFRKLKCREGSQLCKLSQLCYHFCLVLKIKSFFWIFLAISRLSLSINQSILPKKLMFLYIFNNKKSDKFK